MSYYNPSTKETISHQELSIKYNTSIPASREEFKGWYLLHDGKMPTISNSSEEYIDKGVIRHIKGKYYQTYFKQSYSEEVINNKKIAELKEKLKEYDYIGIKIATGCAKTSDYAEEIALCESYREEINRLEERNASLTTTS